MVQTVGEVPKASSEMALHASLSHGLGKERGSLHSADKPPPPPPHTSTHEPSKSQHVTCSLRFPWCGSGKRSASSGISSQALGSCCRVACIREAAHSSTSIFLIIKHSALPNGNEMCSSAKSGSEERIEHLHSDWLIPAR